MGLSSSTEAKKSSKEVPARPMRESESGERDGPDDLFDAKVGSLSPRIMAVPSPDASSPSSTLYNFTYTPSPPIAIPGSNPRSTYRTRGLRVRIIVKWMSYFDISRSLDTKRIGNQLSRWS